MYVVAITELATPLDAEAAALAPEIGTTAYDARLELAAGTPAVVLVTPDRERASRLLASLRARGHGAVACDAAAVVPSEQMIAMRRFRFTPDGVATDDRPGELLGWGDPFVLVRAQHRRASETREEVNTRKFSGARVLASGGLVATKKVKEEIRTTVEQREQVLYVFRRSGGPPWILREAGTTYGGLGVDIAPSQVENFARTVRALRERMPTCAFDERLMTIKRVREWSRPGAGHETSTAAWIDLLAHLVALWTSRRVAIPYRT